MAIQTIKGHFEYPRRVDGNISSIGSMGALDAAGKKAAVVFQAPKAGNVAKLCFYCTQYTSMGDCDFRLETVDGATGAPSGSLLAANTNIAVNIAATGWKSGTLTAAGTVVRGTWYAAVAANSAGSYGMGQVTTGYINPHIKSAYGLYYNNVSWAKQTLANNPILALEYDDGSYELVEGCLPIVSTYGNSFASNSNPKEYGIKFKLPFPCRADGAWANCDFVANATIKLYDSDGTTVLSSVDVDKDVLADAALRLGTFHFTATANLSKDTWYRLTVAPSTTTAVRLLGVTVGAAAVMDGLDGGQSVIGATKSSADAWSDVTTSRPAVGIYISGFDDAVGGAAGGGLPILGGSVVR